MANFLVDTFTDTNGTLLSLHTGETGATWIASLGLTSSLAIFSNQLFDNDNTGGTGVVAYGSGTPGSADYQVTINVSYVGGTNNQYPGAIARRTVGGAFYLGRYDDSTETWEIYYYDGATYTLLGSTGESQINADFTINFVVQGTSIKLYHGASLKVSVTDSNLASAGKAGLMMAWGGASSGQRYGIYDIICSDTLGPSLDPGVTTAVVASSTSVTLSNTAASGGTSPYDFRFQRAADITGSPDTYADIGSSQDNLTVAPDDYTNTGLTTGAYYWFRCKVTDADATVDYTDGVRVLVRSPATYYVDSSSGDDAATGLVGDPWETIDKINSWGLVPGDEVRFAGNGTYPGNLVVSPLVAPTSSQRVRITSYGGLTATIDADDGDGVKIQDCGYVTVNNLKVVGSGINFTGSYPNIEGTTTSTGAGVLVKATTASTVYRGVAIHDVEVDGCLDGIKFLATNTSATHAHRDWRMTGCDIHDCGVTGVWTRGTAASGDTHATFNILYRNGYIADCLFRRIRGVTDFDYGSGDPNSTGYPVFVFNAQDVLVENCYIDTCGDASSADSPGGPAGVIVAQSNRVIVRRCEVSNVYNPQGNNDAIGIDFDGGCRDCIAEYNYIHDCEGMALYALSLTGSFQTHTGTIFRYNICQNNGRNTDSAAGVKTSEQSSTLGTVLIHNNTFFHNKASGGPAGVFDFSTGTVTCLNNIVSVTNGGTFGSTSITPVIVGNCWHAGSGSSFDFDGLTSLAAMRAAGYEVLNGENVGASGNPNFDSPGNGGIILPDDPMASLSAYDLGSGSAARGCGVSLGGFTYMPPAYDFHGSDAITGADETYSGIDAGAVRYGSEYQTGGGGSSEIRYPVWT